MKKTFISLELTNINIRSKFERMKFGGLRFKIIKKFKKNFECQKKNSKIENVKKMENIKKKIKLNKVYFFK